MKLFTNHIIRDHFKPYWWVPNPGRIKRPTSYKMMVLWLITILMLLLLAPSLSLGAGDTLSIDIVIRNVVSIEEAFVPIEFALHPPYPNPFNPDVNLIVDIPEQTITSIHILNVRGQEVAVLESRNLQPGRYQYLWQADMHASGIYFVRIQTEQFEKTEKISLLK